MLRLLLPFIILTILVAATLSLPAWAMDDTPTPEADYWQVIAAINALATTESDERPVGGEDAWHALAEDLASMTSVQVGSGAIVPLDHSFLLEELFANLPDVALIHSLTGALLTAKGAQGLPPIVDADMASLAPILAQAEFRYLPQERPKFIRFLMDQWERFLRWLSGYLPEWTIEIPPIVGQIAAITGTVILAALVAYVLAQIVGEFTAEAGARYPDEVEGVPLTADRALQRAQELSTGGDYRTAVRYLYLSTLLLLEERGLLRYDRSLTNREYLRRVAHDPALSVTLQDVVDVFDRTWYGYQPLDESTYQRYAEAVAQLKRYQ